MHTDRLGAAHFVGARTQYPIQLHRCPFFHLPQACSRVTACPYFRNACLRRPRQPLLLRILPMPVVVAEMVPVKSRFCLVVNSARARLRRERGPHIDRHLMGRCRPSLSQIVAGRTDDDIRRYSGPTGLKRRQQRGSHAFLHCFGAFSQRDAAHLLPRFFQPNVRLLCPFFLRGFVAGLCVAAELGLLFPKLLQGQSRPRCEEEGTSLDTPCCSGKPAGCAKSPSV